MKKKKENIQKCYTDKNSILKDIKSKYVEDIDAFYVNNSKNNSCALVYFDDLIPFIPSSQLKNEISLISNRNQSFLKRKIRACVNIEEIIENINNQIEVGNFISDMLALVNESENDNKEKLSKNCSNKLEEINKENISNNNKIINTNINNRNNEDKIINEIGINNNSEENIDEKFIKNLKEYDIFLKVLSYDFYEKEQEIIVIPNDFRNESNYKFIWILNLYNELKSYILNHNYAIYSFSDEDCYFELENKNKSLNLDLIELDIKISNNNSKSMKKMFRNNDLIIIFNRKNKKISTIEKKLNSFSESEKKKVVLGIIKIESKNSTVKLLIKNDDIKKLNINKDYYIFNYITNINYFSGLFKNLFSLNLGLFKNVILTNNYNLKINEINNIHNTESKKYLINKKEIFMKKIIESNIFNECQKKALNSANKLREGDILLIEALPGSGKMKMLIGLLSLFMLNENPKILICSYSSEAIGKILEKLNRKKLYDENLNHMKLNFFRHNGIINIWFNNSTLYKIKDNFTENQKKDFEIFKKDIKLNVRTKISKKLMKIDFKHLFEMFMENKKEKDEGCSELFLKETPIMLADFENISKSFIKKYNYDYLIIYDACRSTELDCLLPLCLNTKYMILIGDRNQIKSKVYSSFSKRIKYNRSLFERLIEGGKKTIILDFRSKIPDIINNYLNKNYYDNKIRNDKEKIIKLNNNSIYEIIKSDKCLYFFDLVNCYQLRNTQDNIDYFNIFEMDLIIEILNKLVIEKKYTYTIITPYKIQTKKLEKLKKINDLKNNENMNIEVKLLDTCDGDISDIVFFSTVRTEFKNQNDIKIFEDFRYLNFVLSKAKFACFILGNSETLEACKIWKDFINYCREIKCYTKIKEKFTPGFFDLSEYIKNVVNLK